MIYLASPYSDPDPQVRQYRYETVTKVASDLMRDGYHVYSPITHSHPIALDGGLPTGWDYWEPYDQKMLSICTSVHVLQLTGWDISVGIAAEIELAEQMQIPVTFIDPAVRRCLWPV